MSSRALLVSTANPYPVVRDGCERLVRDYVDGVFGDLETCFLHAARGDWRPTALYRAGHVAATGDELDRLLDDDDFAFSLFIGFKDTPSTRRLTARWPCFCLTNAYPHPDVPRHPFRGILSHRCAEEDADVLLVGGSYDDTVFRRERTGEEIVLAVGRIDPTKGQLELVSRYRETIFERYGVPLHLAGGAGDVEYCRQVLRHVDGTAVMSSIVDRDDPGACSSWTPAEELAALANRARLYVCASPAEEFGLALVESMACGTTCVVNGDYRGFEPSELRPHVHGNIAGRRGGVLDLVAQALRDDVHIDGSRWVRRYALRELRGPIRRFVDARI